MNYYSELPGLVLKLEEENTSTHVSDAVYTLVCVLLQEARL